jgi:hypothetical protein
MGIIGAAFVDIAGWSFSWPVREMVTTAIPCLLILGLGYRVVISTQNRRAFVRCAPVVALVAMGWLIGLWLVDLFLDNQAKVHTFLQFWADVRFYLGWALGLSLAPSPSDQSAQPK